MHDVAAAPICHPACQEILQSFAEEVSSAVRLSLWPSAEKIVSTVAEGMQAHFVERNHLHEVMSIIVAPLLPSMQSVYLALCLPL